MKIYIIWRMPYSIWIKMKKSSLYVLLTHTKPVSSPPLSMTLNIERTKSLQRRGLLSVWVRTYGLVAEFHANFQHLQVRNYTILFADFNSFVTKMREQKSKVMNWGLPASEFQHESEWPSNMCWNSMQKGSHEELNLWNMNLLQRSTDSRIGK